MPEPDFDQIARDVPIMSCDACASGMRRASNGVHYDDAKGGVKWGLCQTTAVESIIAEQLRQVWNARGAADAEAVDGRIRELVAGEIVGTGIARHVAEVITKLDR